MNLILLFDDDFVSEGVVRITGRRRDHVLSVHRAEAGDELTVGVAGGLIGRGRVIRKDHDAIEMTVSFETNPPWPVPVTLILALPRPKVLNRVVGAVASLGIKRVFLINAWRVEKSYWKSPRMSEENLRQQCILGLEQGRDTILPSIETRRFFRPFVEDELPEIARGTTAIVAHPYAAEECPRAVEGHVTLAIGPEGGFIADEIASMERAGMRPVSFGARILRVETAVSALIGRIL